jgi:quercetin dioxygenase-like cupin family protein
MDSANSDRILDFPAAGMWWEVTRSTQDTGGAYFEAINVLRPTFAGPPLHVHPGAEESYEVVEGKLDVCVDGAWRTLSPGEKVVVAAGVPHTLRNSSGAEVRLVNVHKPALDFERFFRRMHGMVAAGETSLPPKGFAATARLSMLFVEHEREIVSVKPPRSVMRFLAFVGRRMGCRLPA